MFEPNDTIVFLWLAIAAVYGIGYVLLSLHSTVLALYGLFAVVTFGNFVSDYGLIPDQVNWLTEISILILFLKSVLLKKSGTIKQYSIFFPYILFLFSLFVVGSIIVNLSNPVSAVLCLRLMFRYVVMFIALINLDLHEPDVRKVNKLIVFLVLIQLPVATIKLFFYGQGEMAVGTYAGLHGGTLSTVLPLAVIPFAIGYYLHYRRSNIYFFIAFAFVGYSVIGGKRAFIFFLPPVFLYLFLAFGRRLIRQLGTREWLLGSMLILGAVGVATQYVDTLNPDKVGAWLGGGGKKGYGAVLEYAYRYNTLQSSEGVSQGRISTTLEIFNSVNEAGVVGWAFGFGPGSFLKSRFVGGSGNRNVSVGYGMTQLTWTLYQFGIVGTILYFAIPLKLLLFTRRFYQSMQDPYWRALFFGLNALCFTEIMTGIAYCYNLLSDFLPCIFLYLAAVAVNKVKIIQSTGAPLEL